MTQGHCGSAQTWQKLLTKVLSETLFTSAIVYLDDVLLMSKDFNQHMRHLELDGQGRARREAARRRKSECKVNLDILNSSRSTASKGLQKLYPKTRGVWTCVSLQRTSTSGVSICAQ